MEKLYGEKLAENVKAKMQRTYDAINERQLRRNLKNW